MAVTHQSSHCIFNSVDLGVKHETPHHNDYYLTRPAETNICLHLPCQLNMEYTCSLFQVKSTVNDETDHLPTELCKVVDAAASRLEVNCIHESWWVVGTDLYKL